MVFEGMAMCEEKCERALIDQLMKAMRNNSVPYPIEHSVYFLGLRKHKSPPKYFEIHRKPILPEHENIIIFLKVIENHKILTKYLEMYDTETRALALILFIGINGYEDDGVKAQHSLVNPWIDLSSRWLVDVGIKNFNVGNMHCLLQAAFELAVSSFRIEEKEEKFNKDRQAQIATSELIMQEANIILLKNITEIIESITNNAQRLVKKEIKHRYYVDNGIGLNSTLFSPRDTSIKKQMYNTDYLKELEGKVKALKEIYDKDKEVTKTYMQLYFWLRLKGLLNVKLVLDRPKKEEQCPPVTKLLKNSYIYPIQNFANYLIGQNLINYHNKFFDFFIEQKVNADNYYRLEEKLANLPFIVGDFFADYGSKGVVDFDSFLIKLKKESVDCYSELLTYEKAAATVAYSITDPFMFKRDEKKEKEKEKVLLKDLPYTKKDEKKLRYQWDDEIRNLRTFFITLLNNPGRANLGSFVDDITVKEGCYYSAKNLYGMVDNLRKGYRSGDEEACHNPLIRVFQSYKDFGIVPAKAQFAHALQQKIRNI
jgi:hypothetical protein